MKLTLNQKRFLVYWMLFHSFALFVNVAGIYGTIHIDNHTTISIFTDPPTTGNQGFWPFVSYSMSNFVYYRSSFHGIFYNYRFSEYIFYIVLGLVIIFVPKLTSAPKPITTNQTINPMKPIKSINYYYSDDSEFRKVFKSVTEKVQLLAIEFNNPIITQYWGTASIDNGALFFVTDECGDASITYRITKIFKECLS